MMMETNALMRFEEVPERGAQNYFLIIGFEETPEAIERETRKSVAQCPVLSCKEKEKLTAFLDVFHYSYIFHFSRFYMADADDRIGLILARMESGKADFLSLFSDLLDLNDAQFCSCKDYIIQHAGDPDPDLWNLVRKYLQEQVDALQREPWENCIGNEKFQVRMWLETLFRNDRVRHRLSHLGVSVSRGGDRSRNLSKQDEILRKWLRQWTPKKIKRYLDSKMVGQHQAKKVIAGAVYMHVLSLLVKDRTAGIKSVRNNILLLGPTGSGKTYIARLVNRILPKGITVCFLDGAILTPEAYRGPGWADTLQMKKKELAGKGISLERSILFVDEVDKLLLKNEIDDSPSVISQMLTCLEGTDDALIGDADRFKREDAGIRTDRMSFFFAGAFEEVIRDAKGGKKTCGFVSASQEKTQEWSLSDLRERLLAYGIRDEFEGRISEIATLSRLSDEEISALVDDEIYPELTAMCEAAGATLTITPDARARLGEILLDKPQFGVRGLQNMLLGIMYEEMRDGVIDKTFRIGLKQIDRLLNRTVTW